MVGRCKAAARKFVCKRAAKAELICVSGELLTAERTRARSSRRAAFQMPQDFVIRFDEQFVAQIRIRHFSKFLTMHNNS